jgi:hypothetical protein
MLACWNCTPHQRQDRPQPAHMSSVSHACGRSRQASSTHGTHTTTHVWSRRAHTRTNSREDTGLCHKARLVVLLHVAAARQMRACSAWHGTQLDKDTRHTGAASTQVHGGPIRVPSRVNGTRHTKRWRGATTLTHTLLSPSNQSFPCLHLQIQQATACRPALEAHVARKPQGSPALQHHPATLSKRCVQADKTDTSIASTACCLHAKHPNPGLSSCSLHDHPRNGPMPAALQWLALLVAKLPGAVGMLHLRAARRLLLAGDRYTAWF